MYEIIYPDVQLINSFAERFDLCWCIDIHTIKPEIVGQDGASIYCYSEKPPLLGLVFVPDELPEWNTTRRAMIGAGMTLVRDCLSEAYVSFDPTNEKQCQLALSVAGIRPVPDSAANCATMRDVLTKARARKAKAVEHQRELALIRDGADMEEYQADFQPCNDV